MKTVLTIAGSDSSGGAGIQADLKTMCALGVFGMSAITTITAQNTQEVRSVLALSPEIVAGQIDAVFEDIHVDAVKVGMIFNADIASAVTDALRKHSAKNIVLDPVMVAKSGGRLIDDNATRETMRLAEIATVLTPNIMEAEILAGMPVRSHDDMEVAAREIQKLGIDNVMLKGGANHDDADDYFLMRDSGEWLQCQRIPTKNVHGAGCTLSSAIACYLALGHGIQGAVHKAKQYVTRAIGRSLSLGHGNGPLGHLAMLYHQAGYGEF